MEIEYTLQARKDLEFWKKTNNVAVLKKIRMLVEAIGQSPYKGVGKPEALKYKLAGCWSRRINKNHRIVYEVFEKKIIVLSLKDHYS